MNNEYTFSVTWGFLIGSAWIMLILSGVNRWLYDPHKRPTAYALSIPGFYLAFLALAKILS